MDVPNRNSIGKLVMVVLVKNEADIIEHNIKFHLNLGVDFVVAIDNKSVDSTRRILEDFEEEGILRIIDEPGDDYSQKDWMNNGIETAINDYQADWVIPIDCDEFWWPISGNLKTAIKASLNGEHFPVSSISCKRYNMLEEISRPSKSNVPFYDYTKRVTSPFPWPKNVQSNWKLKHPWITHRVGPKVIVSANCFASISVGNHLLDDKIAGECVDTDKIRIYHYPIRTYKQFHSKVKEGGSSLKRNNNMPHGLIWHWRRWYDILQQKKWYNPLSWSQFKKEYAFQFPDGERMKDLSSRNIIQNDYTIKQFFENRFQPLEENDASALYDGSFYKLHDDWLLEYESMCKYLMEVFSFNTVLDLGCGMGAFLSEFIKKGINVRGIDASSHSIEYCDPRVSNCISIGDLRFPIYAGRADLVICTEVAEHLDEIYADNLVDNVCRAAKKNIFFTAATPVQTGGINHVNLQEHEYWYSKFEKRGIIVDWDETKKFRLFLNEKIEKMHWFKNNSTIMKYRNK